MESLSKMHVESTRAALLEAGRRLFGARDFASLSTADLVGAAGLTRGALYHHFDGKRGLFEVIFEELEADAANRIGRAIQAGSDPFDRADRGAAAFLEVCTDDAYRHIVLLQGPIALGWTRWRELDQRHLGRFVLAAIVDVLQTGLVASHPPELLAGAFYGALTELSIQVAQANDRNAARAQAVALQRDLLLGLLKHAGTVTPGKTV